LMLGLLAAPTALLAQSRVKATVPAPADKPATEMSAPAAPASKAQTAPGSAQMPAKPVDPPAPDGFQKYYFVMLLKGAKLDQDKATLTKMMEGHLEYMEKLAGERTGLVDGTFMDGGTWRGFMLVRAKSIDDVKAVVENDPVVQAGRVVYEIHPWMTESTVFEK
jgi:uncharacterized protein YciI